MKIVKVYLKGDWAPGNKNHDKGYQENYDHRGITLVDDDFGLNRRRYPLDNIARVEDKDNWTKD